MLRLLVGMVVGIWMARHLGAEQYGVFNYVITFLVIFEPLLTLGLEEVVVKRLGRDKGNAQAILGSAATIRFFAMALALPLMLVTAALMNFESEVFWLIVLYTSSALFSPLNTIESYYYSKLEIKKLVLLRSILFVVLSLVKVACILLGYSVSAFVLISTIEVASMGLISWLIYAKEGNSVRAWQRDSKLMRQMLGESLPIFMNNFVMRGLGKIDQLFIAKMASFSALGLYGAAARLLEVWVFLPQIISNVFFTRMVASEEKSDEVNESYFSLMLWTSIGLIVGSVLLGDALIYYFYGEEYEGASIFLKWYSVQFAFVFFANARLKYFANLGMNYLNLWLSLSILSANIVLNVLLIRKYGPIGAIYASLWANGGVILIASLLSKEARRISLLYLRSAFFPGKIFLKNNSKH